MYAGLSSCLASPLSAQLGRHPGSIRGTSGSLKAESRLTAGRLDRQNPNKLPSAANVARQNIRREQNMIRDTHTPTPTQGARKKQQTQTAEELEGESSTALSQEECAPSPLLYLSQEPRASCTGIPLPVRSRGPVLAGRSLSPGPDPPSQGNKGQNPAAQSDAPPAGQQRPSSDLFRPPPTPHRDGLQKPHTPVVTFQDVEAEEKGK